MTKYYLDKQFQDSVYKDTYYSYEQGAFDDMYFDTEGEAFTYLVNNLYRLEPNERLEVMEA